jgi:hypothetical protein
MSLGMRLLSGRTGLECTNCSFDPRYVERYDYLVEVAIVKCGPAVHLIRLCPKCVKYACKLVNNIPRPLDCDQADEEE